MIPRCPEILCKKSNRVGDLFDGKRRPRLLSVSECRVGYEKISCRIDRQYGEIEIHFRNFTVRKNIPQKIGLFHLAQGSSLTRIY